MTKEKETILIVDDEEPIRDIGREFLTLKGYRVLTAEYGVEALDILKNETIDCCFTDLDMPPPDLDIPNMDGIELAEHIRAIDNTIPVVVVTGNPNLNRAIKSLQNGVVDFLVKPVPLSQWEMCLQKVLRERRLFIDNIFLKQEVEKKKKLEQLTRQLTHKVGELQILAQIMEDFTTVRRSFDVFKRLVDMGIKITKADSVRFYIANDAVQEPFEVTAAFEKNEPIDAKHQKEIKRIVMQVVRENKRSPLLLTAKTFKGILPDEIQALLLAPLMIRENIFGVLTAVGRNKQALLSQKILDYLAFMNTKAAYSIENLALYENIYDNLLATLDALVQAIEAKDPYTKEHSRQVTDIAIAIAKKMERPPEDIGTLEVAGPLHDIGKIGIPDSVLLKPSRLTSEEYEVIKRHPDIGSDIVGQLGLWEKERQIIRHHHERFDGNGYPDALSGEDIPLMARILSVADVFDAMASRRIYRNEMNEGIVVDAIKEGSGSQFDPEAVSAFVALYEEGAIPERVVQHVFK